MSNFEFNENDNLDLDLCILEKLYLHFCINIIIGKNSCLNIKELYLDNCLLLNNKSSIKFPKLNYCELDGYVYKDYSMINFSFIKTLKYFKGTKNNFLLLGNCPFEKIILRNGDNNSYEIEKEVIEKIIKIKTLKSIKTELEFIKDDEISSIQGENNSILYLKINWENKDKDCIIYNLEKKFPNLKEIYLHIEFTPLIFEDESAYINPTLDIKETFDCKFDKLNLFLHNYNKGLNLYCQPLENLVEIKLEFFSNIKDLNIFFPLFSAKCTKIFRSLKVFHLKMKINIYNALNNFYNNINNNCIQFVLQCMKIEEQDFYKKLIIKLLSLDLESIEINNYYYIKKDLYSKKELKEIYPDINFNQYKKISISKN